MANPGSPRPDYKERMAQKRRSGGLTLFLYAAVIGGAVGLAYVKRAELKTLYDSYVAKAPATPTQREPEKSVEKPQIADTAPAESQRKAIPPPVAPKSIDKSAPEAPASLVDMATARVALTEGKTLFEKFQFNEAVKLFAGVEKLKLGALAAEVQTAKQKAVEFGNATRHIPIADFAQGENAVLVSTIDGSEWRGLKTRETDDQFFLQAVSESNPASEGKQIFPIAKSEIKSTVPLPLSQRRAEFAELLASLDGGIVITHSSDFYDLIFLSKRLGLGKECVGYLNRAFDGAKGISGDPRLGDTCRGVVVRRAISRASLLLAANRRTQVELELKKLQNTLPGFTFADDEIAAFRSQVMSKIGADFQSSIVLNERKADFSRPSRAPVEKNKLPYSAGSAGRDENEIEISVDNKSVVGRGPAAAAVEKANARFEQGAATFRRYKVGVGGNKDENNRNLIAARALLNEAIDMYEDALKLDPGNKAVRDRQQSAGMMVYSCNKNLIL